MPLSLCSNLVDIMTLRIIVVIWHTETLATDEAIHEHALPLRGLRGSVSLSPPVCHGSPVGRLRSDLSLQSHLLRVCVLDQGEFLEMGESFCCNLCKHFSCQASAHT